MKWLVRTWEPFVDVFQEFDFRVFHLSHALPSCIRMLLKWWFNVDQISAYDLQNPRGKTSWDRSGRRGQQSCYPNALININIYPRHIQMHLSPLRIRVWRRSIVWRGGAPLYASVEAPKRPLCSKENLSWMDTKDWRSTSSYRLGAPSWPETNKRGPRQRRGPFTLHSVSCEIY